MHDLTNPLKRALQSGGVQYGVFLGLPDNSAAEIAAGCGFDWLLIDQEHGAFELATVLGHLQVLAAYDVAPIVRPASDDPTLLKKLLDIGAQSLVVPMVDTAEQAEALVRAVRYPPQGIRGIGTSMARAARWNQAAGYVATANQEICLIVQAETAVALDNLDAILAVNGVDGVFIGPSDLSASMGHIGDPGHPDVVSAIDSTLQRISAAGKHAGVFCMDPELAGHYIDQGANFLAIGTDTLVLSQGLRQTAARFRGESPGDEKPKAGY
jgi:4-hydroxy-2-oxoheptanedioate aldolase